MALQPWSAEVLVRDPIKNKHAVSNLLDNISPYGRNRSDEMRTSSWSLIHRKPNTRKHCLWSALLTWTMYSWSSASWSIVCLSKNSLSNRLGRRLLNLHFFNWTILFFYKISGHHFLPAWVDICRSSHIHKVSSRSALLNIITATAHTFLSLLFFYFKIDILYTHVLQLIYMIKRFFIQKNTWQQLIPLFFSAGLFILAACSTENSTDSDTGSKAVNESARPLTLNEGKTLYESNCAGCHDSGSSGAPKLGDKAAWRNRIAEGNDVLLKKAIAGIDGKVGMMPPKGGNASLTDEEVKTVIGYMTSKIGTSEENTSVELPILWGEYSSVR